LALAYFAILVLLLAAIVQTDASGSTTIWTLSLAALAPAVRAQANDPAAAIMSITPFYAVLFGFSLVSVMVTMVGNTKIAVIQGAIFAVFIPYIATLYRNYMVLATTVTGAFLIVCSLYSLFALLTRPFERLKEAGSPMGSDTFSHLLYYAALVAIIAASGFCGDLQDFVECLAIGFLLCCGGTAGIIAETLAFRGYSPNSGAAVLATIRQSALRLLRRAGVVS
jgi:hypothetical protein